MKPQYTRRFRVRHYELDALGHVNNVVFVQYMQEAAIEASAVLGFGPEWYREQGTAWVVRRLSVRYLNQLTYGDAVDAHTWVSDMRGVRSTREYDLQRVRDGVRVARGRAEWIYIDATTGLPTRFPDGWADAFKKTGEAEDLGIRLSNAQPTENAHRYRHRRQVQFTDLDPAQHVNHAVYLDWINAAYFDIVGSVGLGLEQTRQEGWIVFQAGHEIQYFAPARLHDPIEIVSWITEMGKVRGAWTHEVYNPATGQLLARDYSLGAFVNLEGKPTALPPEALRKVLQGP